MIPHGLKDNPDDYWELHERRAEAGFEDCFLVPVYPRPERPAAS